MLSMWASSASSAVGFDRMFPLRQALNDDLRGLGRRLTHVRISRNLLLDALTLVLQVVAQHLQLGDELIDLHHRRASDALDERIEIARAELIRVRFRLANLCSIFANELADRALDFAHVS